MKIKFGTSVLVAAVGCTLCHAALVVDVYPPENVLVGQENKDSFTQLFASTAMRRGQTFTMPDGGDAGRAYRVNSITLQKSGAQGQETAMYAGEGAYLKLMVYEWDPADDANDSDSWATSGGSNKDPWNGTGMTEVYSGLFPLNGLILCMDEYMHFNFDTPLTLNENKAYGFLVQYFKAGSEINNLVLQQGRGGANNYAEGDLLRADGGGKADRKMIGDTDLTFWISGKVIP
jgi:hypothetical protein